MFNDLDFIGKDAKSYLDLKGVKKKIWKIENLLDFSNRSWYAITLILREKEILLFSLLQIAAIGLAYYLWVQVIGWIPMDVWESNSKINDIVLNLAFLAWSFFCVALAAYPIAILTGAMGAAHFLRQQGHNSTIAACLTLALKNSTKLWAFHTIDAWLTVNIIFERLPEKGSVFRTANRAIEEAIYYAWKVGSIAVPAALLTGKGLIEAGEESIDLVKHKLWDVLKLRSGYSAICWIIGITTYVGSILFFIQSHSLFEAKHTMFVFYFWMGVPILVAVTVVNLFVRPIFVIASCKLYSDFLKETGKSAEFRNLPGKGTNTFVAFLVFCLMLTVIYLYREKIGLLNILRVAN